MTEESNGAEEAGIRDEPERAPQLQEEAQNIQLFRDGGMPESHSGQMALEWNVADERGLVDLSDPGQSAVKYKGVS
jgi:hypothetical protein